MRTRREPLPREREAEGIRREWIERAAAPEGGERVVLKRYRRRAPGEHGVRVTRRFPEPARNAAFRVLVGRVEPSPIVDALHEPARPRFSS